MWAKEFCQNRRDNLCLTWLSLWFAGVVLLGVWSGPASSRSVTQTSEDGVCQAAALLASQETGVPLNVLLAITLSETGRKKAGRFLPWPWTVNMEGKGSWFKNRADALAYVSTNFKTGARSFDIGCFQINFKWHGKAFSSIDQMFSPDLNALYAAKYLYSLYNEMGNWKDAAGAYHSRSFTKAKQYAERFSRILLTLDGPLARQKIQQTSVSSKEKIHKRNHYPLLKTSSNSTFTNGSLVSFATNDVPRSLIQTPPGRLF